MKVLGVLAVAVVLAAFGWRAVEHKSNVRPALVTPETNVHLEFSDGIVARMYRVSHETTAGDRSGRPKLIALTFDDGPYPIFTPMLLDMLAELKVPATFFLIGQDAQQWPEITHRIEAEGHEVADHTYTHPNLDQETQAQVQREVIEGRDALWALTHDPATRKLMRPPHGRFTESTLEAVQKIGYNVVLWTDDGGDWRTLTVAELQEHMLTHATAPEIVLLHSGKLATIEALPLVVKRFKEAGYRFVTVGTLLDSVTTNDLNHPLRSPV